MGRSHPRLVGVTAAVLASLGPGTSALGAVSDPACSGVRVVVAPPAGPERVACAETDGTATAAEVFGSVGHELARVERFPGAVCRVDGVPADDPCVAMPAADASWGFFDSEAGEWHYATAGVDLVEPATGSAVALVWQDGAQPRPPATPAQHSGDAAAAARQVTGDQPTGTDPASLPGWVPYAALVGLGGLVVLLVRRRRS